jgi:hypothetical protein
VERATAPHNPNRIKRLFGNRQSAADRRDINPKQFRSTAQRSGLAKRKHNTEITPVGMGHAQRALYKNPTLTANATAVNFTSSRPIKTSRAPK